MNKYNEKRMKKVCDKLLRAVYATAITATLGAPVAASAGIFEKINTKKEIKELRSLHDQSRECTVINFEYEGELVQDNSEFLRENGYLLNRPLEMKELGLYHLDVLNQDGKPVGVVEGVATKNQGFRIGYLQVLEEASDLIALVQKQAQWKKESEGKVFLLENEALTDARARQTKLEQLTTPRTGRSISR